MYSNERKMLLGSSLMLAIGGAMMLTSTIMLSLSIKGTTYAADMTAQQLTDAREEAKDWTTHALSPDLRVTDQKSVCWQW